MRSRSPVVFLLGAAFAIACAATIATNLPAPSFQLPTVGERVPWTKSAPLRGENDFDFAVVTDRTGEHRAGVFEETMPARVNLVRPEFVMSVGDLIEGYTDDPSELDREWGEIASAVGKLDMPFFYAVGNHDMSNAVMAEKWKERLGPSYYHFTYKGALFLVLNSELFGMALDPNNPVPGPWKQAEQMEYVERVLGENAGARWTFVFLHQPLWDSPSVKADWLKVEQWLGNRPYTVFAGHYHRYTLHRRNDRQFITLATSGAGSDLRGTPWGEFDEVAHVSMTDAGPVIANLRFDGILPTDIVTDAQRALVLGLPRAIQSEPVTGDADLFRTGTARFSIANSGKQPLVARGRAAGSPQLDAGDVMLAATIAPGQVANLELPLRARAPQPYESLAPAHVHWTLDTVSPSGAPISVETESIVLPERPFAITRAAAPIRVDGDLGEWSPLAFEVRTPGEVSGPGSYGGPADASFAFDLRQDDGALYAAVLVRDDSVVSGPDRKMREQDHVTLSLDARPEPARVKNGEFFAALQAGELAKVVTVFCGPEPHPLPDPILTRFGTADRAGVVCAGRRTSAGYIAEMAVPAALLDDARGARWDAVRVNVAVTDFDEGKKDHSEIAWRPSRYGAKAVAGAGTFVRK
jgi:hypothetical protein